MKWQNLLPNKDGLVMMTIAFFAIACVSGLEISPTREATKQTKPAPFDHEVEATVERTRIDYNIKITKQMAEDGTASRRVRVYADGIYDLFHNGHARQLQQAKNIFPNSDVYLIVGICNDTLTEAKKCKTVMKEQERYDVVRHCKYVDEIVADAPWEIDANFLAKNKIDFVAHDEIPYAGTDSTDIYAQVKANGMFVTTERTEGVSSTEIIARILSDADTYERRIQSRGLTLKDIPRKTKSENGKEQNEEKNKDDVLTDNTDLALKSQIEQMSSFVNQWSFLMFTFAAITCNVWNLVYVDEEDDDVDTEENEAPISISLEEPDAEP